MTVTANRLSSNVKRSFNPPLSLYSILIVSYHLYILIIAAIFHENKISEGGISIEYPKYFGVTIHSNLYIYPYFRSLIILTSINIFIIGLALYYRDNYFFRKHTLLISMIYGFLSTMLWEKATGNLIIVFINFFLSTSLYFYWIRFGNIRSFFDQPIVHFTFLRSLSIIPLIISTSIFYFIIHNYFVNPIAIAASQIRQGRDGVFRNLLIQYGIVDEQGNRIPNWIRYLDWMNGMMYGDFGNSYISGESISNQFFEKLWESGNILLLAFIFSLLIGFITFVVTANYPKSSVDKFIRILGLIGTSMPVFFSGILVIIIFGSSSMNWYPIAGAHGLPQELADQCEYCYNEPKDFFSNNIMSNWVSITFWLTYVEVLWIHTTDSINHLILPVFALTFVSMSTFSRFTRSLTHNVMNENYIIAARANGVPEHHILRRHVSKIFLLTIIPYLSIMFGFLITSALFVETVFSFPGFGFYFVMSVARLDLPILMFLTMFITSILLFLNLVVDVVYVYFDPRFTLN